MISFFTKKIKVPASNTTKEVETLQTWEVSWYSRYGRYHDSVSIQTEVFLSEETANEFAEALQNAFKLLRHTSGAEVKVVHKDRLP